MDPSSSHDENKLNIPLQIENVLNYVGRDKNRACATVFKNALGTDLSNELFTFLSNVPRDPRSPEIIKEDLLSMDKNAYAKYQQKIGGFTRDRYPYFKSLSPREVMATVKPDDTTKDKYSYSGQTRIALPMKKEDPVHKACNRISDLVNCGFTFALINRYDGIKEYISHHQDNEKDLDPTSPIASCVVGASRTFEFKFKRSFPEEQIPKIRGMDRHGRVRFMLDHGDVLVIFAQGNFTHSVPQQGKGIELEPHVKPDGQSTCIRYSITLRKMADTKKSVPK